MNKPKNQKDNLAFNYLRFSRSQRRAMIIMLLSTGCFLVFLQWKQKSPANLSEDVFAAAATLDALSVKDSASGYSSVNYTQYPTNRRKGSKQFQPAVLSLSPSNFDPNTAGFDELTALGISEKAARNIMQYRQKGGRFKKPEDLGKIYALKANEVEQLIPFVKIAIISEIAADAAVGMSNSAVVSASVPVKVKPIPITINVNRADSMTWQLLPGIGAKRASAILKFREKLGGFVCIEQVAETFGLPDSVFQKIKSNLEWEPGQIEQLSLNNASEAELKAHPYIGWQWAKIIVAYRNQHGPYQSVDDLMKIHIMKKDWLEQVRPYLKADSVLP